MVQPNDPSLTPVDESQMGISEMAVILMSLVWHQRISKWPNCSAETDLVSQPSTWASSAASWRLSNAVRDEEPVLLIGSPMCQGLQHLD